MPPSAKQGFWQRLRRFFRWCRIGLLSFVLLLLASLTYLNRVGLPEFLKTRLVARQQGKLHTSPKATPRTGGDGDESGTEPRLVKTKRFAVKPMTVDEAILQMEMLGHSFFFFESAASGDAAVVYRRTDGDIGMIERE